MKTAYYIDLILLFLVLLYKIFLYFFVNFILNLFINVTKDSSRRTVPIFVYKNKCFNYSAIFFFFAMMAAIVTPSPDIAIISHIYRLLSSDVFAAFASVADAA